MKCQVNISAAELCSVAATGNHYTTIGFQHWGEPHDHALVMYLTPEEARDIAAHFEALADAMDARLALLAEQEAVA